MIKALLEGMRPSVSRKSAANAKGTGLMNGNPSDHWLEKAVVGIDTIVNMDVKDEGLG